MDGFEIIQYSIMHAPIVTDNQEKQDWLSFLKRGYAMTEEEVRTQIKTPIVQKAFEKARVDRLPVEVRTTYEKEDSEYSRYSEHTREMMTEEKRNIARALRMEGIAVAIIVKTTGLTAEEIGKL